MRNLGLLALIIGFSVVGVGSQARAQASPATPSVVSAANPATSTKVIAAMPGNVFMPKMLTIKVGASITWMNAGGFHNFNLDDMSFRCSTGCDQSGGKGDPSRDP